MTEPKSQMLRNYLNVALRNLARQKGYAAVNIIGLAVGMACALLLLLFVRSEMAVNDIFPDAERIYRVDTEQTKGSSGLPFLTPGPVAPQLERQYPAVESQARMYGITVTLGQGREFYRESSLLVDPSFFDVFEMPLNYGTASTALDQPRSAVIRQDLARSLFGSENPLGQTIEVKTFRNGAQPYTVTGVWEKLPKNSATQFAGSEYRVIVSETGTRDFAPESAWSDWESQVLVQFIKLAEGTDVAGLRQALDGFLNDNVPEQVAGSQQLILNPLTETYLTDRGNRGWERIGLLTALAAVILLIAGINFTNLSTARSLDRTREIGVRKTLGAHRRQLVAQFLAEAVLTSLASAVLGLGLAVLWREPFAWLVGTEFALQQPWDLTTIGSTLALGLVVGLLSGAYPAFVLSGFEPMVVLRDRLSLGWSAGALRRVLVVFQFAVAIVLLTGVHVLSEQLDHVTGQDFTYPADRLLVIESAPRDFSEAGYRRVQTVRQELEALPMVESASVSWDIPMVGTGTGGIEVRRSEWPQGRAMNAGLYRVDPHFHRTYDLDVTEGRFFRTPVTNDSSGVVINEAAAEALDLDEPIGATIEVQEGSQRRILGVVSNFNQQNARFGLHPVVMTPILPGEWFRSVSIQLAPGATGAVDRIRSTWARVLPEAPFSYRYMSEIIATGYSTERQMRRVVGVGAGLALFVALLGLFGLTGFTVRRRTKEIGVRKACGASVSSIVALLSSDVAKLIGWAFVIGGPIGFLGARQWLQEFESRIELTPIPFLAVGVAALIVALAAVSVHTIRAARINPAETLHDE